MEPVRDNQPSPFPPKRKKTLAGRILKGIGLGLIDVIPGVAQVVNTVNADRVVNDVHKPARALTGLLTLPVVMSLVIAYTRGHVDADTLVSIIRTLLGL